jgi:hypothetical protein
VTNALLNLQARIDTRGQFCGNVAQSRHHDDAQQDHFDRIAATRRPHVPAVAGSREARAAQRAQFNALYERSLREPEKFWLEQARTLEWFKPPTVARKFTWDTDARIIKHTFFRGRRTELERQLPRPSSENPRQPDRHHLAGRTGRGSEEADLRGTASRSPASSPTRSNPSASKKATAWRFTCR